MAHNCDTLRRDRHPGEYRRRVMTILDRQIPNSDGVPTGNEQAPTKANRR
jgi:hypothetical protein